MKLTRRFTLGALALSGCGGLPAEEGPRSLRFPFGVASGDPTPTGVIAWTKYTGQDPVELELWLRDGASQPTRVPVTPRDGGFILHALDSLSPSTWYRFAFVAGDERSDEGQFKTAPARGALPTLRFGVSSCSRQSYALTPLTRLAQEFECDAFLFLGDTVYADGANTLAEYRAKWAEGLSRRPQRLLRASTAMISTWDDHEIINDASGDRVPAERLAAARQATFEHQPWHAAPDAPERLWRSLRFGETAEVFVLDCRSERSRARNEYLSRSQLDWLKQGLEASTATFKVILNSVPITEYRGAFFQVFAPDRWEGFPEQRREVLRFIDETPVRGVLWLTGDFHMGVAGRVAREGPGSTQVEVAAGPAGQTANPSFSYPAGPQFDFSTAVNNAVVLDLDPGARTARVQFVDGGSKTLFDHVYEL